MSNTTKPKTQSAGNHDFAGFPAAGPRFLADLEQNNDRAWFSQHKALYQEELKVPAERFASLMAEELKGLLKRPVREKIFRIHRDLRFSKDKRPYNSHLRMAFFEESGDQPPDVQQPDFGFYLSIEPRTAVLGGGSFAFDKALLAAYRDAVSSDGEGSRIAALVDALVAQGYRLNEPELKRVPSGFDKDHPRASLLRRKGLALWRDLPDHKIISSPKAVANCLEVFAELLPLRRLIAELSSR